MRTFRKYIATQDRGIAILRRYVCGKHSVSAAIFIRKSCVDVFGDMCFIYRAAITSYVINTASMTLTLFERNKLTAQLTFRNDNKIEFGIWRCSEKK